MKRYKIDEEVRRQFGTGQVEEDNIIYYPKSKIGEYPASKNYSNVEEGKYILLTKPQLENLARVTIDHHRVNKSDYEILKEFLSLGTPDRKPYLGLIVKIIRHTADVYYPCVIKLWKREGNGFSLDEKRSYLSNGNTRENPALKEVIKMVDR